MIFTGFKRKSNQLFLNKNFNSLVEKFEKKRSTKIERILFFTDDFSEIDTIKNSLSKLFEINDLEKIEVLVYQIKGSKKNVVSEGFSIKDFGWYGKIKSEFLKNILTKKYDLLINYCKVENLHINLLLLQCNSNYRAGYGKLDQRFYDLLINCNPADLELFNSELKKYLTILNKL